MVQRTLVKMGPCAVGSPLTAHACAPDAEVHVMNDNNEMVSERLLRTLVLQSLTQGGMQCRGCGDRGAFY